MNSPVEVEYRAVEERKIAVGEHAELEHRDLRGFHRAQHAHFVTPGAIGGYGEIDGRNHGVQTSIGTAVHLAVVVDQAAVRIQVWSEGVASGRKRSAGNSRSESVERRNVTRLR